MKDTIKLSFAIFMCTLALIVACTAIKVMDRHNVNLLHTASKKLEEAARKCHIEGACREEVTTLDNLIQAGYIEQLVHPISKEYISGDLIITCKSFVCETDLQ